MTTPATIQVQENRGETMTAADRVESMTGDQRPEIAAHTPGPWRVYDHGGEYHIVGPTTENGPWLVATTVSINETDEANARLIAAAPVMLEALRTAVRLYETYGLIANISGRTEDKMAPGVWVNSARAAIAKAEKQS